MNLKDYIAAVPDFPKEGILFRDITPLMQEGAAFKESVRQIEEFAKEVGAELIAGPESRGFIFGCPVAANLNIGFVPVRKPGKLPRETRALNMILNMDPMNSICIKTLYVQARKF